MLIAEITLQLSNTNTIKFLFKNKNKKFRRSKKKIKKKKRVLIFSIILKTNTRFIPIPTTDMMLSKTTSYFQQLFFQSRPLLCMPSLLLTVCELIGDVSDALVAAGLLLAHLGAVPAALYSAIAILVLGQ